jgi:hypothetical protein
MEEQAKVLLQKKVEIEKNASDGFAAVYIDSDVASSSM